MLEKMLGGLKEFMEARGIKEWLRRCCYRLWHLIWYWWILASRKGHFLNNLQLLDFQKKKKSIYIFKSGTNVNRDVIFTQEFNSKCCKGCKVAEVETVRVQLTSWVRSPLGVP